MAQVTVGTTPVEAAPRDAVRKTITFSNRSTGGQVIHISQYGPKGLTTSNSEFVLAVGETLNFIHALDGIDITGDWGAIADGAGGTLVWSSLAEREAVK